MSSFSTNPVQALGVSAHILREASQGSEEVGELRGRLCSMIPPVMRTATPPLAGFFSGIGYYHLASNVPGAVVVASGFMAAAKFSLWLSQRCGEDMQIVIENAPRDAAMQANQQNADLGIAIEQGAEERNEIQTEIVMPPDIEMRVFDAIASNLQHSFEDGTA